MEIIPGVHAVPGTKISRIYLIEDNELTLVDTGMPWSVGRVFKYITSIGRQPSELSRILVTHSHPDHTGGAPGLRRRSNAQIVAHHDDTVHRRQDTHTLSYAGVFASLNLPIPYLSQTLVDRLSYENEVIPAGGGIRVIHTPGHTPGSVCYLLERDGVLFSGDTIFSEYGRVSRSMPFPGSDTVRYQESLERLASADFDILCGGHGSPLVGGASRMLRVLMARKPHLPTWREFFFKRVPSRLLQRRGLSAEDY